MGIINSLCERVTFRCKRNGTLSGMLWEWLVIPQVLSNAPATFNRLVTQLFRHHRRYAQTYFDDILVHSRAEHGRSDIDNHIVHLRAVLECMRTNKLHVNASKCIFARDSLFKVLHWKAWPAG